MPKEITSGTTNTTIDNLDDDTTYEFTISAVDNSGNESSQSVAVTVTTNDATAPAIPANLAASNVTASSVDLSWDASTSSDVDHYNVYTDGQ